MQVIDLGCIPYDEANTLQQKRLAEVAAGAEQTLYLLEHPPTITFGKNGGPENLLASKEWADTQGVTIIRSERGGNITCHFPGQLVAYPIVRIAKRPGGMRQLFTDLEQVVINTVAHFGLSATRQPDRPGVWLDNRKICSIGIAMRKWTSYHGLALNVMRDVSLFNTITLCGLPDAQPTSLCAELNRDDISMQEVKDVLAKEFRTIFENSPVAAG